MAALCMCACGSISRKTSAKIPRHVTIMRILTTDNPEDLTALRNKAKKLTKKDAASEWFAALKPSMLATVTDPSNTGVGIAAPQVGIGYRLIAVQRFDKEDNPFEFYINPEITAYSEERVTGDEGCLSVPSVYEPVSRSAIIDIRYRDQKTWKWVEETVSGFTAVIFQHEADHLDGILFTDRIASSNE